MKLVTHVKEMSTDVRSWDARRLATAVATTVAIMVLLAIPTDLIDTPFFVREMAPTWWSWPVLAVNAVLAGLVSATYVARKDTARRGSGGRLGWLGALGTFFAIGCPVCNKLVLLTLGYTGAIQFFEPVQPYLAVTSIIFLTAAFVVRLKRERSCVVRPIDAMVASIS